MKEEKQKVTVTAKELKPYIDDAKKLKKSALSITENLYRQLGGCFELYSNVMIDTDAVQSAVKDELNKLAIADGLDQSNNLQTAIVRYVFGKLSRDVVSKYATTIKVMQKKELATDVDTFAQYLLDNGGYTSINNKNVADSNKLQAKVDYVLKHICKGGMTLVDEDMIDFNDKWIVCLAKKSSNGAMDIRYIADKKRLEAFIATNVYPPLKKSIGRGNTVLKKDKKAAKDFVKQLNALTVTDIQRNADAFSRLYEEVRDGEVVTRYQTADDIRNAVVEKVAVA